MKDFGPPTATIRQGADEVRAKLKSDLSQWARVRRGVSLRHTMGCVDCDATGKLPCVSCGGSGHQKFVMNEDKPEPCLTCQGKGYVTCAECSGRGVVPNTNRKKVLWVLSIGCLAWLFVLYRLWNPDILPAQMAGIRGGGGGKIQTQQKLAPTSQPPGPPGGPGQPGNTFGQPGSNLAQPGGPPPAPGR